MWTKHDSDCKQVARIGRIVRAQIVDNDDQGTSGYFVMASTATATYDGPIFDTLGECARKTPGLPMECRQVLFAGFTYEGAPMAEYDSHAWTTRAVGMAIFENERCRLRPGCALKAGHARRGEPVCIAAPPIPRCAFCGSTKVVLGGSALPFCAEHYPATTEPAS